MYKGSKTEISMGLVSNVRWMFQSYHGWTDLKRTSQGRLKDVVYSLGSKNLKCVISFCLRYTDVLQTSSGCSSYQGHLHTSQERPILVRPVKVVCIRPQDVLIWSRTDGPK